MPSQVGGRGPLVLTVSWSLAALAIFLVTLRAFAASKINNKWRWDFIWAALSCVFGIIATVFITMAVMHGLGNHLLVLARNDIDDVWATFHWGFMAIFVGLVASTFSKNSMVALLLQVQGPNARKRRIALLSLCALYTIVNILQLVFSILTCNPRHKLWDRLAPGNCNGERLTYPWTYLQGGTLIVLHLPCLPANMPPSCCGILRFGARSYAYLHCMELEDDKEGQSHVLHSYGSRYSATHCDRHSHGQSPRTHYTRSHRYGRAYASISFP